MGGAETHTRHNTTQPSSRLGLLRTAMGGGEIVEVQGGHIVRSTGRKDRHSKVCTAKGPRDRRVRLSAHTAIQFYDVQDRLGYDRPSKAVDWLIKNAKPAIDELAELPPWHPTATTAAQSSDQAHQTQNQNQSSEEVEAIAAAAAVAESGSASGFGFQNPSNSGSSFLPPSLDSDAIADTIKSFFPMAAAAAANTSSSSMAFQNYSPDLLSRTNSQSQDLRLSLHSFHDHHHHHPIFPTSFAGSANWSEQQPPEMGRFSAGIGDYIFNSLPPPVQILQNQNQSQNQNQNAVFSSQRGPLQSSISPQVRAWIDQPFVTADHHQISALHQSAALMPGIGFTSGGFAGFRIPARIQGEEEHDAANKPASASRH